MGGPCVWGTGGYDQWEDATVFLLTAQKEGEEIFFEHICLRHWTFLSPYVLREVDVTVSEELSQS